jgi:hypothetical protein
MAIDLLTFRSLYPEFASAPDPLVQAKLVEAEQMVPDAVWGAGTPSGGLGGGGSLTQQATFLYCAQFLAKSPFARSMNLVSKTGETIYDERIQNLKRVVTSGFRVL